MTTTFGVVPVVLLAILGLLVGSFLNVVIYRVPRGESVVSPRSRCPGCGQRDRRRDNIPVAVVVAAARSMSHCSAPISARYPVVEVAHALLWLVDAVALRTGAGSFLPTCTSRLSVSRLPSSTSTPSVFPTP